MSILSARLIIETLCKRFRKSCYYFECAFYWEGKNNIYWQSITAVVSLDLTIEPLPSAFESCCRVQKTM